MSSVSLLITKNKKLKSNNMYTQKFSHIASGKIPEIIVTLLVHTKKKNDGKVMESIQDTDKRVVWN